jgi:hypothetical protein
MDGQGSTSRGGGRRRRAATGADDKAALPTPKADQELVDAEELAVEARYDRMCQLGALIEDAVRRAEAMTRLERALAQAVN